MSKRKAYKWELIGKLPSGKYVIRRLYDMFLDETSSKKKAESMVGKF